MTTELEQEFFKVFGIESKELEYPDNFEYYPEITAEKLLQIMIIYSKDFVFSVQNEENTETLKQDILKCAIDCAKYKKYAHLKHQVRSLFEKEK